MEKFMGRHGFVNLGALLLVSVLVLTVAAQPVGLTLEHVQTWYWTNTTSIQSLTRADIDGDDVIEIITGGEYYDGERMVAQLCVWDGEELKLERVQTWYWTFSTHINSVVVGDVDGDTDAEIVTGGTYSNGTHSVAQLCVWEATKLVLENVQTWQWTGGTEINSVAVDDVDNDDAGEIVTGGYYDDGKRHVAQLCVWSGATLALENVETWFWTGDTEIFAVAVMDVDGDVDKEIVTGGRFNDKTRYNAQVCVWDGEHLGLERVQTWYWTGDTHISSVCVGNVDGDAQVEIVTGGSHYNGIHAVAQLCVWNGATLALENVKAWYWTGDTYIESVARGNVDGNADSEIVTGGCYFDAIGAVAQLCVWNGATLALENVETWDWDLNTYIHSIGVGNVDGDGQIEIVTGGNYMDNFSGDAQLCVWAVMP